MMSNRKYDTKKLVTISLLTALAFGIMVVGRFSLIPAAAFLKYDAKDVVIAVGGFLYGPLTSLMMSAAVSFLEMITVSESGIIGCVMNIISTVSFTCTAAFIYKKNKTLTGAVMGLLSGVFLCTVVMLLWNYLLVPIYTPFITREAVMGMLLPVFLPFNLLKGGLNAALTMLLYKPLRAALDRSKLLPIKIENSGEKPSVRINIWTYIISFFVLASCVLIVLSMFGII